MGPSRRRGTFEERKALAIGAHKLARLVIFASPDPQADAPDWVPVLPDDVPEAVRENRVIGALVNGAIVREAGGERWYRAEAVDAA